MGCNDREYRFDPCVRLGSAVTFMANHTNDRRDIEFRSFHDGVRVGPDVTIVTTDRELRFAEGVRHVSRNEFSEYLEGIRPLSNDEALRYVDVLQYMNDEKLCDSIERVHARWRSIHKKRRFNQYVFQV